MGTIGSWGRFKWAIKQNSIKSFTDLSMKAGSDLDTSSKKKTDYVKRKNGQPREISFTVILNANTGCKVKSDLDVLLNNAQNGLADYLYIGGKKNKKKKLMMTAASAKKFIIGPKGQFVYAEVDVTLKQAQSNGGGSKKKGKSGSKGRKGSRKQSVRSSYTGSSGSSSSSSSSSRFHTVYGANERRNRRRHKTSSAISTISRITSAVTNAQRNRRRSGSNKVVNFSKGNKRRTSGMTM